MKQTNTLKKITAIFLIITALSSCNVNNGLIQKRKYTKGYHVSIKKKINNNIVYNANPEKQELQSEAIPATKVDANYDVIIKNENTESTSTPENIGIVSTEPTDKTEPTSDIEEVETVKREKTKRFETRKKTVSILAKINPLIVKWGLENKIAKAFRFTNETSNILKERKYSTFVRILFFIGGIGFLYLALLAVMVNFYFSFNVGAMLIAFGSVAIGILLLTQVWK